MAKKEKEIYSGCLKGGIDKARDYAQDHFVYGLRTKEELVEEYNVSAHSIENSFRNMENWFQDCLQTRPVSVTNKKHIRYISVNCREHSVNPLYKMWKACSFTTNEIVFFFFLLNHLYFNGPETLNDMYDDYCELHRSGPFEPLSAQKMLSGKIFQSGIVMEDEKKKYKLAEIYDLSDIREMLCFYSEIAPCGVVGSFILDKADKGISHFRFKQHYIGQAFDSEMLCNALYAIRMNRKLGFDYVSKLKNTLHVYVIPIKVFSSTQNGRQYLVAWDVKENRFSCYRLDRIKQIDILEDAGSDSLKIREIFEDRRKHMWGVSPGGDLLVHVEFTVKIEKNEAYILNRLNREKRCGKVSAVEGNSELFLFETEVYDAHEMFPWIRTFICRIVDLKISDKKWEELFWKEVDEMYRMYSLEGDQV